MIVSEFIKENYVNPLMGNIKNKKLYSQNTHEKIFHCFFTHSDLFFKYNSYATSKYKPLNKKELFNYIFTFLNDHDLRELKNAPEESWVTLLATRVLYKSMLNTILCNRVTILFWEGMGLRSQKEWREESKWIQSIPSTGHIALKTYSGGPDNEGYYISYYPKKNSCNCGEKKRFESHYHTLKEDLLENVTPKKFHLYTLNVKAINSYYEKMKKGLTFWEALAGSISGDWDESYHTCASLTYKLLQKGGIEELATTHVNEYYGIAGTVSFCIVSMGTVLFAVFDLFNTYVNYAAASLNVNNLANILQTAIILSNIHKSYTKSLRYIQIVKHRGFNITCNVTNETIIDKIADLEKSRRNLNPELYKVIKDVEPIIQGFNLIKQKKTYYRHPLLESNNKLLPILNITEQSKKLLLSLDTKEIEEIDLFNDKMEQGDTITPFRSNIRHQINTLVQNMKLSQQIYWMMRSIQTIFLIIKLGIGSTIGAVTYLTLKIIYSIPTPGGVAKLVINAENEEKKIAEEQKCEKNLILKEYSNSSRWKPIKNLVIKTITASQGVLFAYLAYNSWYGRLFK